MSEPDALKKSWPYPPKPTPKPPKPPPSPPPYVIGNVISRSIGVELANIMRPAENLSASIIAGLIVIREAVESNSEFSDDQKRDILDILTLLSEQSQIAPPQRKLGLIKPLLQSIAEISGRSAALSTLWVMHGPRIIAFFLIG